MRPEEQIVWFGWWSAATLAIVCFTMLLRRRSRLTGRPSGRRRGPARPMLALLALMLAASIVVTLPLIEVRRVHGVDATPLDSVLISLNWYWSRLLAAWMLLAGAGLAIRSLIGDPARGRRRCPRCWYEIGPGAIAACPECGRSPLDERRMGRTRRPRRLLLAAIALGVAAAPVWLIPDLRRGTWPRHLSTPTLVAATARWPDQSSLSRSFMRWASGVLDQYPRVTELPPGDERRRLAKRLLAVASLDEVKYPEHVSSAALAMSLMGEDALVASDRLFELANHPSVPGLGLVVVTAQLRNRYLAERALPVYAEQNPGGEIVGGILQAWPNAFHAPQPLIELARAESREQRLSALYKLQYAKPSPILLEVLTQRLGDTDEDIREAALEALCRVEPDSPASVQARTAALDDDSDSIRNAAARLIGEFGPFDPWFIEPLLDGPDSIAGSVTRMLGRSTAPLDVKLDLISRALDREALLPDALSACFGLRADAYHLRQQLTRIAAEADARGDPERARRVRDFLSRGR